jgi:phospholipid/cholesterol/gamma-HCH transport system substrate-binding protein
MRRGQRRGISRTTAGAILVVVAVIVTYFGFTKAVPFKHHFEIKADFKTSNNLRVNSPVRIAGVNVGKVTKVEPLRKGDEGVRVTMRVDKVGRPIHKDATIRIRPRIFLEGNFFLDVQPGTPSAPKLGDGDAIPMSQTSTPVQLDQILTALQSDTRHDLQLLLQQLGVALSGTGATGFNKSIQYWKDAFEGTAVVNDATLGILQHDLSNYVKTAGVTAGALDRDPEALKSLVTDFNTTAAAFAVEQANLESTVAELPRTLRAAQPALKSLNDSFPPLRRLIVDLRPATRSSLPAINASLPFVRQARRLVAPAELRGLTADLRPLVPNLARLNKNLVPLYEKVRSASSCQNEVVLPWSHSTVADPNFPATGEVYQEGVSGLPGLAAESRSGDANGQWARVVAGNGANVYALGGVDTQLGQRFGISNFPIMGVNPPKADRPPSRYDVPCETQQTPDLRTIASPAPSQMASGQFNAEQSALNQANQFEGVADSLLNEGKPQLAKDWYEKARSIRIKNNLLGKQWDLKGGHLTIVDTNATKLTAGGAPPVAPALLHGSSAVKAKALQSRFVKELGQKGGSVQVVGRLQGISGQVNAKKGGSG